MEKARRLVAIVLVVFIALFLLAILLRFLNVLSARFLDVLVAMLVVSGVPLSFLLKRLHVKIETQKTLKEKQEHAK